MNKLKKFITENGEFIGSGVDREAYLYQSTVFKILTSTIYGNQTLVESHNIQNIKKKYGNLKLLPEYTLYNNSICSMEYVENIALDIEHFLVWCAENNVPKNIYNFYEYCRETFDNFKHFDFLEEFLQLNLDDIETNLSNFGYSETGYIKIIDLGMC